MMPLRIINIGDPKMSDNLNSLSLILNSIERHSLNYVPWSSYSYKPLTQFAIAYSGNHIFLKYFVTEKAIRAMASGANGPVWKDSCVEFFISFDNDGYYNFEFNCIGTALVGFGKEKTGREMMPEKKIEEIRFQSVIQKTQSELIQWELVVVIPLSVFIYHQLPFYKGRQCRVNFYKCGDDLPEPHFISWKNIQSDNPNFHLPQFFGEAVFE